MSAGETKLGQGAFPAEKLPKKENHLKGERNEDCYADRKHAGDSGLLL